jgi:hypothetical protein
LLSVGNLKLCCRRVAGGAPLCESPGLDSSNRNGASASRSAPATPPRSGRRKRNDDHARSARSDRAGRPHGHRHRRAQGRGSEAATGVVAEQDATRFRKRGCPLTPGPSPSRGEGGRVLERGNHSCNRARARGAHASNLLPSPLAGALHKNARLHKNSDGCTKSPARPYFTRGNLGHEISLRTGCSATKSRRKR